VSDTLEASKALLRELEHEQTALLKTITAGSDRRGELKLCHDRLEQDISKAEASERALTTQSAALLTAWFEAPRETEVAAVLDRFGCAYEISEPAKDEYRQVPVSLKSNRLTYPLNMITEMYSLPAYGTVDPNPLMAPFFILFYGIMMADTAYGLLMLLTGLIVTKKKRPGGQMGYLFKLIIPCGISTFFFGLITGGFMGDFIPTLLKIINPASTFIWFWKPLFNPLSNTMEILVGSMVLGFIHLLTGTVISFCVKTKSGNFKDAFWSEGVLWLLFIGGGLAFLKLGAAGSIPVPLLAAILLFVYGSSRNAKGIGKAGAVFGAFYNTVTGWFGDILSYSRLMALMIAGSVIASVFNTIGAVFGLVPFIIVSLFGNALNLGLNLLGCFVHDLRLQCLEYFGKFYQDGGRPFRPLKIKTKYVDISN
jgi:V/A-type H+-transporting ATPase subunit I